MWGEGGNGGMLVGEDNGSRAATEEGEENHPLRTMWRVNGLLSWLGKASLISVERGERVWKG